MIKLDMPVIVEGKYDKIKLSSRRYAKRQLTWFRRNTKINWLCKDEFSDPEELCKAAFNITKEFLEKK